jgi:hypothetical protein
MRCDKNAASDYDILLHYIIHANERRNDQSINTNNYTVGNYYIYCCSISISIFICFIILFIDIHLFTLTFKWNTRSTQRRKLHHIYIYIFFVVISLEIHNIMYDVVYFNFYSIPFHCLFVFSLQFIFTLLYFFF